MNEANPNDPEFDEPLPELSAICEQIEFSPGMQVDRYILEKKIGAGGMGAVYLARHVRLKSRLYAIKFIKPGLVNKDIRQRFEAEIDALEKIQHPNFVFAHDAGEFRDVTYLVMEYVDGASLSQILASQTSLPVSFAAEIVRQTAAGLQHAHEQGLVHRDIKPSNLVLTQDGTVKILDLGLARFCNPDENHGLTGSLQILGTPDYMSPEQCRSSAGVDIRSDIYSLGCTLYRLIAGKAPFSDQEHSSIANKIVAHISETPAPIQSHSIDKLPRGFVSMLDKMLAKRPEDRFQTPAELLREIEAFTGDSSLDSLVADSLNLSAAQVSTKTLNAPSAATDQLDTYVSTPKIAPPPNRLNVKWIVAAVLLTVLGITAWSLFGTGATEKTTAENSAAPVLNDPNTIEPKSDRNNSSVIDTDHSADNAAELKTPAETPIEPGENEPEPANGEAANTAIHAGVADLDPAQLAASVKQIFRNRCSECHGAERKEADLDVLAWNSFVSEDGSVVPSDADGSYLFERIATDDDDYRMPESPLEALSQSEIETVRKWIEVGAAEFPADVEQPAVEKKDDALADVVGAEYVLTQIVDFIEQQPREDRPYYRFFSSNDALTAGATKEELKTQHQALAKAINHLSMQPTIVRPTIVDEGLGTVFAVDIRKLGWQQRPFRTEGGQPSDVDIFDLILLEYPYSIAFPDSTNFEELWDLFMSRSEMVRPIPYLRIDWFVSIATQYPLYEDILGLPLQLADLEEMIGVDSEMNMRDYVAKRAGMTVSGVSQNNRVAERHPSRFGCYWKSYDFETSKGRQNMFVDPVHFDFAGGEMVFSLPNGLHGYLITDTEGNRINAAPTSIVTDKFAPDKTVRNGLACMRCHDKGVKRFADNIRPAIEKLPGSSMLDKNNILRLYPAKDEMDKLLDIDEQKFTSAMEQVLGEPQGKDPLTEVSRNFLDNAIALKKAASEMGLKDTGSLKAIFVLPQFTRFGLAGLTRGGVIRRDTWEDYYDRIVRSLGVGVPVAPIDGLIREDHLADGRSEGLIVKTNKRSNIFAPGDKLIVTIENRTGVDLFIEMTGTGIEGNIQRLSGVERLANGDKKLFPNAAGIPIEAKLGSEKITVFASPNKFSPGLLLKPKSESTYVADRFIHHHWYQYDPSASSHMPNNPTELIKKTLKIETR